MAKTRGKDRTKWIMLNWETKFSSEQQLYVWCTCHSSGDLIASPLSDSIHGTSSSQMYNQRQLFTFSIGKTRFNHKMRLWEICYTAGGPSYENCLTKTWDLHLQQWTKQWWSLLEDGLTMTTDSMLLIIFFYMLLRQSFKTQLSLCSVQFMQHFNVPTKASYRGHYSADPLELKDGWIPQQINYDRNKGLA